MKVFAISDLHLSINNPKPMDIFGPVWDNYLDKIILDWKSKVGKEDVVLLAGDHSWAMKLEDATSDLEFISSLPGIKILIRGNHDYWWSAIGKVRSKLPQNMYALQNDSLKIGNYIFCGTRGWSLDDEKLVSRELIRLEMSLKDAIKKRTENEKIVCMLHFPPFDKFYNETEFTKLIEKYNVDFVVYGHLHLPSNKNAKKVITHNNVKYFLTSCDILNNTLTEII